ncbi:phage/plasmid replication domain-containing protein [Planococcus halotolerans]|uniref:Replication-associated protein G2P N-terminal domain-containing protein n=1 Tax=Planococcus halotolerans TaxID=2233542 RepID=A0A365L7W9_9BACL|nr:phage/plasmid replication protein [Planococcus halotolerans]RAZ81524.1 hypothetical protein DP120_04420 [Planococcus halotolerans]
MFDTVKLKLESIHISETKLQQLNASKVVTYYKKETGELIDKYQFSTLDIPFIIYFTDSQRLLLQLSIPKFLFGENVTNIKPRDIDIFWEKLKTQMYELLGVEVEKEEWVIQRVDICWNFQVGSKVSEYIDHLGKKKLPRKNTICINQNETVMYKNKSNSIMFYDKQKECEKRKQNSEIIHKAKGILRLEITPSMHDVKKYIVRRQAHQVLSVKFFKFIVEKTLRLISLNEISDDKVKITQEWLNGKKHARVETVLGFQRIHQSIGVVRTKELYGSTYYSRIKLIEEIGFPIDNTLPPLKIKWEELSVTE